MSPLPISFVRRLLAVGMIACLGASIAGCGKKVDGKYVAEGGIASIEFKSGKAILTSAGISETDDYTIDGDKITVKSKAGDLLFTIMQDGSLQSILGTLKKSAG